MELCDVTLREGDQMPGRDYSAAEKVAAGRELAELGVSFVQAGFPVTGEKDRNVIRTLAAETDAKVVALARAIERDVEAALDAEADVVEVFAPLNDDQLEHAVGRTRDEMLDSVEEALGRATDAGVETHLSILDAFRTDTDHIVTAIDRFPAVEYVTLADTVGARTPVSVHSFLETLDERADLSSVGVHFHDDLGVATGNVLAAHEVGIGRADVSVASLGERAGNSSLEQVVATGDIEYDDPFGVDPEQLIPACERVLDLLDEPVDPRTPLLGEEVTSHEAGLHTAAMLEEPSVFEPFDPARFGGERTLLFGAGSGDTAARRLLERAGVTPTDDRIEGFLDVLADRGPVDTERAKAIATELYDAE